MKHTQGIWEVGNFNYPDNGKIGRCEIRQDFGILAHVYLPAKNQSGYKEGQANAKLIAEAPRLLEACKRLLKVDLYADGEGLVSFDYPNTEEGDKAKEFAEQVIESATT